MRRDPKGDAQLSARHKSRPRLRTETPAIAVGGNEGIFGKREELEPFAHDVRCPECGSIAIAGSRLIVHRPECSTEKSLEKWNRQNA